MNRTKVCESCSAFVQVLLSIPRRSQSHQDYAFISKAKVEQIINGFHAWIVRRCICCLRDPDSYDQFYWVVQSLTLTLISKLKDYRGVDIITPIKLCTTKDDDCKENVSNEEIKTGNEISGEKSLATNKTSEEEELWKISNLEKLIHFTGVTFLLHFPLNVAQKLNFHSNIVYLTNSEVTFLREYCDLHDLEVPIHLLINVGLFCRKGGVQAITSCFEHGSLPIPVAHALIGVGYNLKQWFNGHALLQLFVPFRTKVLRYMCHMPDKHLHSQAMKSMTDWMWSQVKDPINLNVSFTFYRDEMEFAFKYFTSTTLTIRLAGISQINSHIKNLNDSCNNENADAESVGQMIASWLIEKNIISHIFGPNSHVEIIKQSHIISTFLAMKNKITNEHIDIMWQAGQLKHCSKHVYDLLLPLIQNLEVGPVLHLCKLLDKLEPKDYTKQTLYLASEVIKLVWSSRAAFLETTTEPIHTAITTGDLTERTNSEVELSNQGSSEKTESETSLGPTRKKRRTKVKRVTFAENDPDIIE